MQNETAQCMHGVRKGEYIVIFYFLMCWCMILSEMSQSELADLEALKHLPTKGPGSFSDDFFAVLDGTHKVSVSFEWGEMASLEDMAKEYNDDEFSEREFQGLHMVWVKVHYRDFHY